MNGFFNRKRYAVLIPFSGGQVMSGFTFLMITFSLVCFFDILIGIKGFLRGGSKGIALGFACMGAFVVTLSYAISIFVKDYFTYSVLSSIYFGGIDFTLVAMMVFNWYFIDPPKGKGFHSLYILIFAIAVGFLLLSGWKLGFTGYMGAFIGLDLVLCGVLYLWLKKRGCGVFAAL